MAALGLGVLLAPLPATAATRQRTIRTVRLKSSSAGSTRQPASASNAIVAIATPTTTTTVAPATTTMPTATVAPPRSMLDNARLQSTLETWVRTQHDISEITVAVRRDGTTWTGSARADGTRASDPLLEYRAMSVTKTMTAALVLRAVQEGKLTLDGPLPALSAVPVSLPAGASLTVRDLLTHRSGFVDYTAAPGYRPDEPMTPEHAVAITLAAGLNATPGATTRYTNSNYLYLGLLVEQVEQRPYADLVASMLAPLGLTRTNVEPPGRPGWAGFSSGGVVSDVADLALWGEALFTPGRVLNPASLAQMTAIDAGRSGLGLWAECPCSGTGPSAYGAIGHHTAEGGMFVFPADGLVLVMRADIAAGDTAARAISLEKLIRSVS